MKLKIEIYILHDDDEEEFMFWNGIWKKMKNKNGIYLSFGLYLTAKKEFVALKSNWKCIERTNKVRLNNGLGKSIKSVQDSLECQ